MVRSKIVFALALISAASMSLAATPLEASAGASMDTQIRQASIAIGKLAEDGLRAQYVAASSQDTQMNIAKAAIAKLAAEGLATQ